LNTRHENFADIPRLASDIRQAILSAERPIIATHARVDADAVGSAIGLAHLCRGVGVAPHAVRAGDFRLPPTLDFIDVNGLLSEDSLEPINDADLVIFVDCADEDRAGDVSAALGQRQDCYRSINIDHHVTNTRFADINLVIPEAAATCEILVHLLSSLEISIAPDLATALMAGAYGDTLGLKTPSTTPATMRACADLYEAGAYLDLIVDKLFRKKPMTTAHLWGEVQARAAWYGRLVWSIVTNEMLERSGAQSSETEGLVNFLAGVEGAFAATLIQESPDGWRVSLRSTTALVDVSELAGHFGGGGHPRAAGCRLEPGRESVDQFLAYIAAELDLLPEDAGTRPVDVSLAG
jgi:bifunctional oligoribonuclease and PAP phosphatase NrnA